MREVVLNSVDREATNLAQDSLRGVEAIVDVWIHECLQVHQ